MPLAGKSVLAELRKTEDGHLGAYVVTHHNKFHPDYEAIKYYVEQGYYPGYSIEYQTSTEKELADGRVIEDLELEGYGFANLRKIMNPAAKITSSYYKEIVEMETDLSSIDIEIKEYHCPECDKEMPDSEKESHMKKHKKGEKMEEEKEIQIKEGNVEMKETGYIVTKDDYALFNQWKDNKMKEDLMETRKKEVAPLIKEAVEKELKERIAKSRPLFNSGDKVEFKELENYKSSLLRMKEVDEHVGSREDGAYAIREAKHKQIVALQYKEAARFANALISKGVDVWGNFKYKNNWAGYRPVDMTPSEDQRSTGVMEENPVTGRIQVKELFHVDATNPFAKIEVKALDTASNAGAQVDTNLASTSWTYGSYFLSPVELNDIFSPVIINQLNEMTTTWGVLRKEDWSGRSQIQFRARTKRNTTAGGYSEGTNWTYGTDFSGQVGLDKFQQPFAYYGARVALTGPARQLALAPGGIGDRWAVEIEYSTLDLQRVLNLGVIGTGAGTSESVSLGFEGLILGTTGTLYGKSLATYGTLRSHTRNNSAARIDYDLLRLMIERVQTGTGSGSSEVFSNSGLSDLVFFCHHTQERFIKGLLQDMQRLVPTSARVGFEGRIDVDGVPIFPDPHMNTDDLFLINQRNTKLGINLPPTVMPLPVTADAEAGLIKIYWNLYSDAPGNNFWTSNLAAS